MKALTKAQKRNKKKQVQKKKLLTKQHDRNKALKKSSPDSALYNLLTNEGNITEKPDYKGIVNNFEGSMEQWYELDLKTHNDYGLGFVYDDLADVILNKIIEDIPESSEILNQDKLSTLSDIVLDLKSKFEHKLIDMLTVVDEQDDSYWNGELERKGLIKYGLVHSNEQSV